ncbi:Ldh family oxidoreductase [Methylovirgula sp. 4M-Z18]|nr:Ldh family oxidoreductase [Methylovirgula sp. 4M-Z18]
MARDALVKSGASTAIAASVARSIRAAEADGFSGIGLGFLPVFLSHLKSGRVNGTAVPQLERRAAAIVHVDAAQGFAQPAMDVGFPALIEAAKACGTASLTITRSYSAGVLGHAVEELATHGLVALAFTNGPPNIAPWGGRVPLFGTNPMAFAVPRSEALPLVIDQSASVVTKVALLQKARANEPLPPGWALDADGAETQDPQAALQGSMAPFGGAKGAAIALMGEIFAAVLTGAQFSFDAKPYGVTDAPPLDIGQFFVVLDPAAHAPDFAVRLEKLLQAMLAQDGVRLPGDRRYRLRRQAEEKGVEVDAALIETLRA